MLARTILGDVSHLQPINITQPFTPLPPETAAWPRIWNKIAESISALTLILFPTEGQKGQDNYEDSKGQRRK
jgi:hypothetical protein